MSEEISYLQIQVEQFIFGVPLTEVIEVNVIPLFYPTAEKRLGLVGEMQWNQETIKIFDVALTMGIRKESRYTLKNPLILCRKQGHTFALLVDDVKGVCCFLQSEINKIKELSLDPFKKE